MNEGSDESSGRSAESRGRSGEPTALGGSRGLARMLGLLALFALPLSALPVSAQVKQQPLSEGWRFRAVLTSDASEASDGEALREHPEATEWRAAVVPGVVQTDLQRAGAIPDPFFGDNEKRLQWIGFTNWEYTKEFDVDAATLHQSHIELVFDGLDTYADVSVNGEPVLSADNQFRSWRVDVAHKLHAGSNTLRILFHSPSNIWNPRAAKMPYIIPGPGYEQLDAKHGIYPISQFMRKAGYSYSWDWGPRFVTMGIWQPVHLDSWSGARVTAFHLQQSSVMAERANVEARVAVEADAAGDAELELHITTPGGVALPKRTLAVRLDRGSNELLMPVRIEHPQRWFPNGYGEQSRYSITAEVVRGARVLASAKLKTGLRSVELRRTPDKWGTSFSFVINGVPVFAKGADFVPLDSFSPNVTDARRRAILTSAHDVHMNMLRIWGGGIYENDSFYDLCDELGIMVWHDFMFGGGLVPGDKAFQDSVTAEAAEQVQRLSDHPSMVLWCGNNEVENAWREWGDHLAFEKTLTPEQRERVWQDYVVMFRDILKSAVARYGNGVPYWPTSPGSNFEDVPSGKENGDMHSWKVWSASAPITDYAKVRPRFLSEFGFQSMPDERTVRYEAGSNEDLNSAALQNHERFTKGYDRMRFYLDDAFRPTKDFGSFVYLSQIMQAEAMKFGVETMRSRRPETMGTLYWQLNDCWPVASWASIDYFGRWKALQYYAARFYAPLLIVAEPDGSSLSSAATASLNVHIVSDEQRPRSATVRLRVMRFDGSVLQEQSVPVQVAELASTALKPLTLHAFDAKATFAVLTLEQQGKTLATNTVYFAKSRELTLPEPVIARTITRDAAGYMITLRSPVLARALALDFGDLDAKPEDNDFDLLPNETRRIHVASSASLAQIDSALQLRSIATATR